jgi:hypothetical protein
LSVVPITLQKKKKKRERFRTEMAALGLWPVRKLRWDEAHGLMRACSMLGPKQMIGFSLQERFYWVMFSQALV